MGTDVPHREVEHDLPDGDADFSPGMVGHAGPYFPYDIEDPRAPVKEKRSPGFVTEDDYVRKGVVKQYKRKPRARFSRAAQTHAVDSRRSR